MEAHLKVCWISGFYNRYKCISRIVRMYLLQDYEGESILLLYNNGPQTYELGDIKLPDNKKILLINNNIDLTTKLPYTNTGSIFNDAISFIPKDVDVASFGDVDDFYSPSHISEGVKGYKKALADGRLGYKPFKSWFKYVKESPRLEHNTMEPSIFVNRDFLVETGMHPVTASYHMKWIDELKLSNRLLQDPLGVPTFLYWWGGDDGVYKTSSGGDSVQAFERLRNWEKDQGSKVIWPCSVEEIQQYYNLVRWSHK